MSETAEAVTGQKNELQKHPASASHALGVFMLAPTGNDAKIAGRFLTNAGFQVVNCNTIEEICTRMREDCGAVILAEEALTPEAGAVFLKTLDQQPSWSDIPVTIISGGNEDTQRRLRRLISSGNSSNVVILGRPFHPETLLSTMDVALRSRRRQYQVRDLLLSQQASELKMQGILESISDAFAALDSEWRFTYLNQSYMKLIAPICSSPADLLGACVWDKFPDIVGTRIEDLYRSSMESQKPASYEVFYVPLNAWLDMRVYPSPQTLTIYIQDITARKRSEKALKELNREIESQASIFNTTLSHITDFAYTFDQDGRFIYVNKPLLDLWGLTLEQAAGKNFFELNYPRELAEKLQGQIRKVIQTKQMVRDEASYTNPEGEEGYYEYIFSPVFSSNGDVEIVAGSTRVITERKRDERALAELAQKIQKQALLFDATLSHMSDLAYSFDAEGRVIYANKPLLESWGRSLDDVVGKNLTELGYPAEVANRLYGEIKQVISTGQPFKGETTIPNARGEVEYHEYIYSPVFGDDGSVVAVAGTTRLITERRQAEYASRRLAAIVESCEDAIFSKDLNGIITSWNDGAKRLFGYEADEIIGQSVLTLIPEHRHKEEPSILQRITAGQRIEQFETERRHKSGAMVQVSLTVSPIKDAEGKVIGASKIVRDISERKAVEKALQDAKDVAEAANHAKDRFLAVLSHELRTPLTPVLMTVASLEVDPEISPDIRQDLAMIRRNVELETKLIDDLLDVSRVSSGKLHLQLELVNLNAAVEQVCGICRPQVLEKGIRLNYEPHPNVGYIKADPARFQQVLWNVVKNAAKFTPENGHIFIRTQFNDKGSYEVRVRDTGIGIKDTMLPLIFNAFEQGDAKITSQFGGLGLGLAISKALVELHHGSIRVESEGLGKGSTFIIELPPELNVKPPAPTPVAAGKKVQPGELRLLVVEDHLDSARTLSRLLRASGYTVKTANSVAAALEIAAAEKFHLLISDIGLPDATGYELMQKIRLKHGLKGIAMSGYGTEDDLDRSRDAGFSEHLTKPLDIAQLRQAILRVAGS